MARSRGPSADRGAAEFLSDVAPKALVSVPKRNRNLKTSSSGRDLCHVCGKVGHYARDCPEKGKKLECFICGQVGHFAVECTELHHKSFGRGVLLCDKATGSKAAQSDLDGGSMANFGCVPGPIRDLNVLPCFARHFILLAPSKRLLQSEDDASDDQVQLMRIDMVARMATCAIFLGHGVRRNVIFDIWAKEGVYRISANQNRGGDQKMFPDESAMVPYLKRLTPVTLGDCGYFEFDRAGSGDPCHDWHGWNLGVAGHADVDAGQSAREKHVIKPFLYLEETAEVSFEEHLEAMTKNHCQLELLHWLETPLLIGDHEGIAANDFEALRRACLEHGVSPALRALRLGRASLFGSACITIVHYLLDGLHTCPSRLWRRLFGPKGENDLNHGALS